MSHCLYTQRGGKLSRRGLSLLEFVGCLIALASGLVIGSIYLGVDMKTLVVGVMEQADIVEPGYFGNQPAAELVAADQVEDSPSDRIVTPSQAVTQETTDGEFEIEPAEKAATADSAPESTLESVISNLVPQDLGKVEPPPTKKEIASATQAYWDGLTACIKQEVSQRTELPEKQSNWQLFDYLSHRAEGHEKAVKAIEALPERAVDEQLLNHGEQVRQWHEEGAKLYRRAVALLTSAPKEQLSGPSAQSWQSSSTQHRMEENLVRDKHFSISNYLNHSYGSTGAFHPAY